jgi:hypothetical protein
MNKSGFFKIQDVIKFIEDVFGNRQSFEIEGGDAVVRNEGRRQEDMMAVKTFLDHNSSDIVFSVTLCDEAGSDTSKALPEVFSNPDYLKVLRNKYREINRTEIQTWRIDYHFSHLAEDSGSSSQQIVFRFTVHYGGEN